MMTVSAAEARPVDGLFPAEDSSTQVITTKMCGAWRPALGLLIHSSGTVTRHAFPR
jgi:hypothetical protein